VIKFLWSESETLAPPNIISDQIKEDEVGGACGTYRMDEKCTKYFGWKT